jgi:hypothetical protein
VSDSHDGSSPARPTWKRRALRVAVIVSVVLAAVAVRVVTSAAEELRRGEQFEVRGDLEGAVVAYRRAARWYAPLSPYHVRALDKLAAIGASAEHAGDSARALSAYRAIRGAILAARSVYVPESARLDAANQRIAALMASEPPPPMDAGKSREELRLEHLALLEADPGPSVGWTLVLLLGFASWVAGAFAFTQRAIDADDRFVPREARRWGALIALGFGLFVLGMALA